MKRITLLTVVLKCVCLAVFAAAQAWAQPAAAADEKTVLATVGGEPIYDGDVERLLGKVSGGGQVNPAALPVLKAQVLAEIVDRRLVLAYARRVKSGASDAEVEQAVGELKAKLESQGRSLSDHLKQRSMSEADLRRQVAWKLVWPKYLARYITDKRLDSYFESHRREFDGTEVSVSHILLRPEADAGPQAMVKLAKQAEAIREAIVSGRISFEEAVRKYSAGPSAKEGGKLGFIARHGAMVESFARAAFGLEVGRLSRPVTTRFGVHLIRCNEVKPGKKQLADVRRKVEEELARELIHNIARVQAPLTPVEFTGAGPYFKPGTRELVVP